MAKHAIVIRELVSQNPIDYRFAVSTAAINNGRVVNLNGLKDHDLYNIAATPTDEKNLWIVTGVELMYEEVPRKYLWDYENAANQPFRCERVQKGLILGISEDGLTAATASTDFVVGASVVFTSGTDKLTVKATGENGDIVIGKVIEVHTHAGVKIASIEFSEPETVSAGVGG